MWHRSSVGRRANFLSRRLGFESRRSLDISGFFLRFLRPLNPKSYRHVIPPYNITDESNIKDMRLRGNDHPSERLLIVEQILLVSTVGIVSKTVERICPPILGFKGLTAAHIQGSFSLLVIITIISFVANVTRRYATRKLRSRGCSL